MTAGMPRAGLVALGLLAAAPVLAAVLDQPFLLILLTRLMLLAVAAAGLNLVMGYGGLVSFGHAAFVGIGAYAAGITAIAAAENGGAPPGVTAQLALAAAAGAVAALAIGAISLRTRGLYFIMITLAFGQMFFYLGVSLERFGGDDGMPLPARATLAGASLASPGVAYATAFAVLALVLIAKRRLVRAPFGAVLRGTAANERRMESIGVGTYPVRLVAFAISGAVCGIAGVLLANLAGYVSPATMSWTRSAELVVVVLLGGAGTVFGPLYGAAAYVMAGEVLSQFTVHWRIVFGPLLILVVLFSRGGIAALLEGPDRE